MKELNKNWLTDGLIDFEYKKYVLLAYLQGVQSEFNERKLFPVFSDLLSHHRNLVLLRQNKSLLRESFPKELSGADLERLELMYKEIIEDDAIMNELEEVMSFAIPKFEQQLNTAKTIFEEVESVMSITPIGIYSLNSDNGFMFLYVNGKKETNVYEYEITIFEGADEKYRGIHLNFLETVAKPVYTPYESLKMAMTKKYPRRSNPATYLVNSNIEYPVDHAILPIAKRMLVRYIASDISR